MPLYEFQCGNCHHRFERIQKFSDPVPESCPACGGGPLTKLPASPAIQFKGSGWYITDYAKKSGADAGKSGSDKTDSSSTPSKTDSGTKTDAGKPSTDSSSSSSSTPTKSES